MDKQMERYGCTKSIDEDSRSLVAVAASKVVDRDGEVVLPTAFRGKGLASFKKNPVIPWSHNWREPPVAKASEFNITDDEFTFRATFAETAKAEEVWQLYKNGFLNAFSVGFMPLAWDKEPVLEGQRGVTHTKAELMEISGVTIPSNREALVKAAAEMPFASKYLEQQGGIIRDGFVDPTTGILLRTLPDHKAITHHRFPLAPIDSAWERETVPHDEMAFAVRSGDTLRLAHHNRSLQAVFRGVVEAMTELLTVQGTVTTVELQAYEHLAKHYEEFEREAPAFGPWDLDELKQWHYDKHEIDYEGRPVFRGKIHEFRSLDAALKSLHQELDELMSNDDRREEVLKEGRVLSASNRKLVENASTALQNLIAADDKSREGKEFSGARDTLLEDLEELRVMDDDFVAATLQSDIDTIKDHFGGDPL